MRISCPDFLKTGSSQVCSTIWVISGFVQQMKLAMDLFGELDQEALAVARGASSVSLAELGPSCVNAFAEIARSIGTNVTCEDHSDLSADQWKRLHHEIGQLSTLDERKITVNSLFVFFFIVSSSSTSALLFYRFCVCFGLLCWLCGLFISWILCMFDSLFVWWSLYCELCWFVSLIVWWSCYLFNICLFDCLVRAFVFVPLLCSRVFADLFVLFLFYLFIDWFLCVRLFVWRVSCLIDWFIGRAFLIFCWLILQSMGVLHRIFPCISCLCVCLFAGFSVGRRFVGLFVRLVLLFLVCFVVLLSFPVVVSDVVFLLYLLARLLCL